MQLKLEPISDDEIPRIVDLMNRSFRTNAAGWSSESEFVSGDRTNAKLLRNDILTKPSASFLKMVDTDIDDCLLGCVWIESLGLDQWYLGSLATDSDRQMTGLGKKLMSLSEQWIQEKGGLLVQISVVNVRLALIEWYIRRGYELTGETEPWPYEDNRWGVPLRKDLAFTIMQKRLPPINANTQESIAK